MFVKVCGLTTREQIDEAIACGYDAIGIVTYSKSRRYCPDSKALELVAHAKGRINTVVVGKTYDDVKAVAHAFDYTQIHEARQVPNLILALKDMPPRGSSTNTSFMMQASAAEHSSRFPSGSRRCQAGSSLPVG